MQPANFCMAARDGTGYLISLAEAQDAKTVTQVALHTDFDDGTEQFWQRACAAQFAAS